MSLTSYRAAPPRDMEIGRGVIIRIWLLKARFILNKGSDLWGGLDLELGDVYDKKL
jgi:hypothetical protein